MSHNCKFKGDIIRERWAVAVQRYLSIAVLL